jgi:hypothetical protein
VKLTISAFRDDHLTLTAWDLVRLVFGRTLTVNALVIHPYRWKRR